MPQETMTTNQFEMNFQFSACITLETPEKAGNNTSLNIQQKEMELNYPINKNKIKKKLNIFTLN